MKLNYDGKTIGTITTNHSMSLEDCFGILGIDISEMEDANTPKWDYELFEMVTDEPKLYHVDLMNDDEGMFGGMSSSEIDAVDAKASIAEYERMINDAIGKARPEVELEHHFGAYGGASICISHLTSGTTLSDEEAISEEISEIVGAIYEKGEFWKSNF